LKNYRSAQSSFRQIPSATQNDFTASFNDYDLGVATPPPEPRTADEVLEREAGNIFVAAMRFDSDHDAALRLYTAAIQLSDRPSGYLKRGQFYSIKGEYENAIRDFTDVIRLDPRNEFAYRWRAESLYFKRDFDAALSDYTKGIQLNPKVGTFIFRSRESLLLQEAI
jgi:tetratricopeptide (TPR) repeat protein